MNIKLIIPTLVAVVFGALLASGCVTHPRGGGVYYDVDSGKHQNYKFDNKPYRPREFNNNIPDRIYRDRHI